VWYRLGLFYRRLHIGQVVVIRFFRLNFVVVDFSIEILYKNLNKKPHPAFLGDKKEKREMKEYKTVRP
jgi:hypothetical protein